MKKVNYIRAIAGILLALFLLGFTASRFADYNFFSETVRNITADKTIFFVSESSPSIPLENKEEVIEICCNDNTDNESKSSLISFYTAQKQTATGSNDGQNFFYCSASFCSNSSKGPIYLANHSLLI